MGILETGALVDDSVTKQRFQTIHKGTRPIILATE